VLAELIKPWLADRELHWDRAGLILMDRHGLEVAEINQNIDKKRNRITAGKALWCKAKIYPGFADIFNLPEDSVGVVGAYDSTEKARKALAAVAKKAGFYAKPYRRSNKREP
jgi:IS5 family transposase